MHSSQDLLLQGKVLEDEEVAKDIGLTELSELTLMSKS
jgi:hypothetical protein